MPWYFGDGGIFDWLGVSGGASLGFKCIVELASSSGINLWSQK